MTTADRLPSTADRSPHTADRSPSTADRLAALEGALLAAKGTIKALADLCLEVRSEMADHCQRFITLERQVHELRTELRQREGDGK